MTQQQQPAPQLAASKNTSINVVSCATVEGRDGPQWNIKADVDFSKFPINIYVDKAEYPQAIQIGVYQVRLERGPLMKGKTADADFNYYWRVAEWGVDPAAAAPVQQQQQQSARQSGPQPQPATASTQTGSAPTVSERQSVFNAAVNMTVMEMSDPGASPELKARDVLVGWASYLWPLLRDIGSQTPVAPQGNADDGPPLSGPDEGSGDLPDNPW